MADAVPHAYKGRITPGRLGWTRIALTLVIGFALSLFCVLIFGNDGLAMGALIALGFVGYAVWTYLTTSLTFLVDSRGITPRLGGCIARESWPLSNFRTVQLREVAPAHMDSVFGPIGLKRGLVAVSTLQDVSACGTLKPRTLQPPQAHTRYAVTQAGTLVEVIGKDGTAYILSPTDPHKSAQAIASFIVFARKHGSR